jgi:DNA-binding response OmpR family regulator
MLLEDALTDAGFELIIVRDGAKALSELESDAARFRGVITDISLGSGPDGWQVGPRARELVAGMPVVYMSGDSANGWSSRGVPNSLMVSKPFAVAQIVTAISTLLIQADAHPV